MTVNVQKHKECIGFFDTFSCGLDRAWNRWDLPGGWRTAGKALVIADSARKSLTENKCISRSLGNRLQEAFYGVKGAYKNNDRGAFTEAVFRVPRKDVLDEVAKGYKKS